ncbi:MAG: class D beta-lactamase [Bacteroidetes bacterium]|nr:class D beta-lactamase [Bacteroidota bacterium]
MKIYYFFIIWIVISSCSEDKKNNSDIKEINNGKQVINLEFQSIIDSAKLEGSILIYDFQKEVYYSNNFTWANIGKLPASTFKIPHSIIALESGIVENDSTLFKWDGKKRYLKNWEQDLIFRDAFHFSCVPCYQEIARKIGEKRMNQYLTKLGYGNMKVDSTNIDDFWLEGDSRISQFQQIDFLKRFHKSKFPISERTERIIKKMIIIEENENYTLRGKTGWSVWNGNNNGWFVGYVEMGIKVYFFATNVEPKEQFNMKMFPKIRKEVTYEALKQLDIIK